MSGADAAELRSRLDDPRHLCSALGLLDGYKPGRQSGGGVLIRCPVHRDRTPSCSVRRGRDGTVAASCFGCGFTGDALTLIAVAHGLDVRADFAAVLGEAARIAGVTLDAPSSPRGPRLAPEPHAYPDAREVAALWAAAGPVEADEEARLYLNGRAIDTGGVDLYRLARVLPRTARAPSWATCRGKPWPASHRLILQTVDHLGEVRSLRAWCIAQQNTGDDTPKRVAPAGKAMHGLVLACPVARHMLAAGRVTEPRDVVLTEGEPDFLTHASRVADSGAHPPAVLGVVAGAWTDGFASRLPDGARVIIRTHRDASGDRYAAEIKASLAGRSVVVLDFKRARPS